MKIAYQETFLKYSSKKYTWGFPCGQLLSLLCNAEDMD